MKGTYILAITVGLAACGGGNGKKGGEGPAGPFGPMAGPAGSDGSSKDCSHDWFNTLEAFKFEQEYYKITKYDEDGDVVSVGYHGHTSRSITDDTLVVTLHDGTKYTTNKQELIQICQSQAADDSSDPEDKPDTTDIPESPHPDKISEEEAVIQLLGAPHNTLKRITHTYDEAQGKYVLESEFFASKSLFKSLWEAGKQIDSPILVAEKDYYNSGQLERTKELVGLKK